jgi:hypothetical protein
MASTAELSTGVGRSEGTDRGTSPQGLVLDPETLPSFAGLSARQALKLAREVGVEVEFRGSGFVREQQPVAGVRLETVGDVVLELAAGRRG